MLAQKDFVHQKTEDAMKIPQLETDRLTLRKFAEDDIDALYLLLKDETVNTFLPWLPLQSPREARTFYEMRYAAEDAEARACAYAVCLKREKKPIGYVQIDADDSHDLGYGLRKEYWHRGIATEAVKAVIEQVKREGLPYITATHDINNPRSGGVMKQAGMKYQYSYEELWQPKNLLVTFRMYQLNFGKKDHSVFMKYWEHSTVHFVEPEL